ncbi:MAG: exodeoxyribonuclease VII small subunit [Planctomycetes bacterium]|nr:exodeoxyribonuclease VII small subunit [Planctomycetota bacterium]
MAKRKSGGDQVAVRSIPGNLKYGEAKERLETILAEIESAEVDVDDLAERVKEAAALVRVLHDKLTRTKAEVEKVVAEVGEKDDDDEDEEDPDEDEDEDADDEDEDEDEEDDEEDEEGEEDDDERGGSSDDD